MKRADLHVEAESEQSPDRLLVHGHEQEVFREDLGAIRAKAVTGGRRPQADPKCKTVPR